MQRAAASASSSSSSQHRIHRPSCRRTHVSVRAAVKKGSEKQVVCSKTLVARPQSLDAVKQLCHDITQFSKDRASDRSAGVLSFECMQDSWDTNVFHFFEKYDSNTALGRHNTTDEFKLFMEKVQPHLERPVGMMLYESKDGMLGACALQGGPKGEGGLDDATGASGAASASSMKQTSATIDLTKPEEEDEDLAAELKKMTSGFSNMLKNMFGGLGAKK